MKKRVLSILLAAIMVISLLPATAFATECTHTFVDGKCTVCGEDDHDHNHTGWTNWGDDDIEKTSLPTTSGSYYLTADVELAGSNSFNNDDQANKKQINLCLNGHKISKKSGTNVDCCIYMNCNEPAEYNLYDCNGDNCTYSGYFDAAGEWILGTAPNGEEIKTIIGGLITGFNKTAIEVNKFTNSTFTIYGGTLAGNGGSGGAGGGVKLLYGSLIMNGGTILGNQSPESGAVWLSNNSRFIMNGGRIERNFCTVILGSGGIFLNGNSECTITGGEISGNKNASTLGPGCIYINSQDAKLTVIGGYIHDNIGVGYQGGISGTGHVELGGTAKIYGNMDTSGNAANCVIQNENSLKILTPMQDMYVGVAMGPVGKPPKSGIFCKKDNGADREYEKYFFSDSPNFYVNYDEAKGLELKAPAEGNYIVNVMPSKNGTVKASAKEAAADTEITLTVTPAEGYILKSLTVSDEDGEITVSQDYKFTMRSKHVTIMAEFMEEPKIPTIIVNKVKIGAPAVEVKNPVYGTEQSSTDFFEVTTKYFESLPTFKLEWKQNDNTWGVNAPTGITATLNQETKIIAVATTATANAGEYPFRVTNSKDETINDPNDNSKMIPNPEFVSCEGSLTIDKSNTLPIGTPTGKTIKGLINKSGQSGNIDLTLLCVTLSGVSIKSFGTETDEKNIVTIDSNAKTYTFANTPDITTATLELTISSANYQDYTYVLTFQTVEKADVTITGVDMTYPSGKSSYNFGDTVSHTDTPSATDETGKNVNITNWVYTYYLSDGAIKTNTSYGALSEGGAPTKPGSYKLIVSPAESEDYRGSQVIEFTIGKGTIGVLWEKTTLEYDPETKKVPSASYKPADSNIDLTVTTDAVDNNVGTYTATADFKTDDPNKDLYELTSATNTTQYTVTPKEVSNPAITVSPASAVYTGTEITPESVEVKDGATVIPGTEYELSYQNNVNVGTANVIVTDKNGGNYTVSGQKTFAITKASRNAPTKPAIVGEKVTINEADRNSVLQYSIDNENLWIDVPTLDEGGSFELSGILTGDHTLYLRVKESANYNASPSVQSDDFTVTRFSVVYNANGGVGSIEPQTATAPDTITVASGSAVSRTGYSFKDWNTSASGSGTAYAPGSTIEDGAVLYAQWNANTYTVHFNANGGSGSVSDMSFIYDVSQVLSESTMTKQGYNFIGWATSAKGPVMYTDKQSVKNLAGSGEITLYAVWEQRVFTVSGAINSKNAGNVDIELKRGNSVFAKKDNIALAGSDESYSGAFEFDKVPEGIYNIVATQHVTGNPNVIVTVGVSLTGNMTADIDIPKAGVNSLLELTEETIPTVVAGLDSLAEGYRREEYDVTVKMTVAKQDEMELPLGSSEAAIKTQESITKIKQTAGAINLDFMNIDIEKTTVNNTDPSNVTKEAINNTSNVLELVLSYDLNNKKNLKIYRSHGDEIQAFTRINSKPSAPYTDGTFYVDKANNLVYIYAQKFSTYALGYEIGTEENPAPHYPGGSTSSPVIKDYHNCPQDETCVYAHFTDADPKAWYHSGVHYCVENKYMNGISYDIFQPKGTLSRAQIVMILWNMEKNPEVNYDMTFKDVVANAWYTEAIRWAQSTGVVEGYDAESFGPNDNVTREQLAAILMRYAKYKGKDVSARSDLAGFNDVDKIGGWALENVKWANAVGIINGRTTTTIVPKGDSTRAEAACMVQRFCENILKK